MAAATVASIITATAAAASAGTAIAGAAMGPNAGPSGRLKIQSPELEFQYLKSLGPQLEGINSDIQRTTSLESALKEKNNIERNRIAGALPSQAELDHLKSLNTQIVDAFGGNTLEAIKNGFLSPEDAAAARGEGPINPAIENSIKNAEITLRDQLRRELGPGYETTEAGRRALGEFQTQSNTQRFEGAQQGLQLRLASRTQGLNEAVAGYNATGSNLDRERYALLTGSSYITGLNASDYNAGVSGINQRTGLRGEEQDVFKTLGAFDLSKQAKQGLESGLIGPGTIYNQTGVSRYELGNYRDSVKNIQENNPGLYGGLPGVTNYNANNPSGFVDYRRGLA